MKIPHDYAARIDYDLWMDCLRVKELDGGTTSINALLNEGLKLVRDDLRPKFPPALAESSV